MPKIKINASIFGHIMLDSELSGRFGVQGNTFKNTFGYFHYYFESIKKNRSRMESMSQINITRLNTLATAMLKLVEREEEILSLNNTWSTQHKVTLFANKTAYEVMALADGQDLLLPGGWVNRDGGHAMIYQFHKEPHGTWLFSMYNAGAGIEFHDKQSSTDNERYFPVKSYVLPANTSHTELGILIYRLILPQLPFNPARGTTFCNAPYLYQEIDKSLPFLQAETRLATGTYTTVGQLSGTCTQRSIHQMLKHQFDTLEEYQQFILEFRLHALHDFIDTHPAPRSPQIAEFIQLGIENTLKWVTDQSRADELIALKSQVLAVDAIRSPDHVDNRANSMPWFTWKLATRTPTRFSQSTTYHYKPINLPEALIIDQEAPLSLREAQLFLERCCALQDVHPTWVIEQIEQALIHFPIPDKQSERHDEHYYYDDIPFYAQIHEHNQFEAMGTLIEQLHDVYVRATKKQGRYIPIPTMLVMQCNFIALRDYFNAQQTKYDVEHHVLAIKPNFNYFMVLMLTSFLSRMRHFPFAATDRPEFDARWLALHRLYDHDPSELGMGLNEYNKMLYRSLLQTEPALYAELTKGYNTSYGESMTELHVSLREEGFGELFYFIQQLEVNTKRNYVFFREKKFDPLFDKIHQQIRLENFFIDGFHLFITGNYAKHIKPPDANPLGSSSNSRALQLMLEEVADNEGDVWNALLISTPTSRTFIRDVQSKYPKTYNRAIYDHKYPSLESSTQKLPSIDALQCDGNLYWSYQLLDSDNQIDPSYKETSNSIQLDKAAGTNQFDQQVFHLRTSVAHQINLTLDEFFTSSLSHLDKPEIQMYVEANIMEPGLLMEALTDPDFLNRFDAFVDKVLKRFNVFNGAASKTSIFILRLDLYVSRFVDSTRVKKAQHRLDKAIEASRDKDTLACLHGYRFLAMMARYELNDATIDDVDGYDAFESYCYMHVYHNTEQRKDTATQVEFERAEMLFKARLQRVPPIKINSYILPMMQVLGINDALNDVLNGNLIGTYPIYRLGAYSINAELGLVYKHNQTIMLLPRHMMQRPLIKHLGLDGVRLGFMSMDGQQFELMGAPKSTRLQGQAIQQKWSIAGVEDWYEWQPLTVQQAQWFQSGCACASGMHLPMWLMDGGMMAWVRYDGRGAFITQNGIPAWGLNESRNLELLDADGRSLGFVLTQPTRALQVFSAFEWEALTQYRVNAKQPQTTCLTFVRYGLSIDVTGDRIRLDDSDYELHPLHPGAFKPTVAHLVLQEINRESAVCLVPIQPFYVDHARQTIPGHYYELTHDTTLHIANTRLMQHWKKEAIPVEKQPLWQYQNTARFMTYRLINGHPTPNNAAEALYLCYLYLATHEHAKANAVLNNLNRFSLIGTREELTFLYWIIDGLPVSLTPADEEQNQLDERAQQTSNRDTACKLKALSFYTGYLEQGGRFQFKMPFDASTAHGQYENLCTERLQTFVNAIPHTIAQLYTHLQNSRRHLGERYTLTDAQSLSLLHCYQRTAISELASGALGYESRRLSLNILLQEYRQLDAIRQSHQALPTVFIKRLEAIEATLAQHVPIMQQRTELVRMPIDLSLADPRALNKEQLSLQSQRIFNVWSVNTCRITEPNPKAMDILRSDISDDAFMSYLPDYVAIARDPSNPEHRALLQFCTNYLTGHRHQRLKQLNVQWMTNMLYRLACIQSSKLSILNQPCSLLTLLPYLKQDVPLIKVYEALDLFINELSNNRAIWDALMQQVTEPSPLALSPVEGCAVQAVIDQCPDLRAFQYAYQTNDRDYEAALMQTSSDDEKTAGALQYQWVQNQRKLAGEALSSEPVRRALKDETSRYLRELQTKLDDRWQEILTQANLVLQASFYIQLEASQRHTLTKEDVIACYFKANTTAYLEATALDIKSIRVLHQQIHKCMVREIERQHLQRLEHALTQATNESGLHHLAQVLMSQNRVNLNPDPALMLFQYEENIILRPRQIDALLQLFSPSAHNPHSFNECVEKIMMGGGKSKVILPILAYKKATGTNLVVVEVPQALLATNHMDLNNTSVRLFGQKAQRFDFNRDSDCSAARLQAIYQQFTNVMIHKDYLVTTGEAIQSLELTYLELLMSDKSSNEQVYWAGKLISLLRQRGDAIVDEVHQGLLLKKKLNYTKGASQPVDHHLIELTLELYRFLDKITNTEPEALIAQLLTHPDSPLTEDVARLSRRHPQANVLEALSAYLHNSCETALVQESDERTKNRFAFYKEQVRLLQQTLHRHHKEHYGPSKSPDKNAYQRALAIPYAANEKPKERSKFGDTLETLNYTVQSLLQDGLNHTLLVDVIKQWQREAQAEMQQGCYTQVDETPTGRRVATFLSRTYLNLRTLDTSRQDDMAFLLSFVRHDHTLLFYILEHYILPEIAIEPHVLRSDAYNHVDSYRSVQGLSGTPWNHHTFHQRLHFNDRKALGTDRYIQNVLRGKHTSIHALDFTELTEFIPSLFQRLQPNNAEVRAIIDISATFKGCPNRSVVEALANYFRAESFPLQWILYFDETDVLCACRVDNPAKIMRINSSDPDAINRQLRCGPETRFTYYDQSHAIGADIKQAPASRGICLVDEQTHVQSFLQGCMRMRGLEEKQQIDVIVPMAIQNVSLDDLFIRMESNEQKQLKEDNFIAAVAKMENQIRNDLLSRLSCVDEDDIAQKRSKANAWARYFITHQQKSLFEQYGEIYRKQATEILLNQHRDGLIAGWKVCLEAVGDTCSQVDKSRMTEAMNQLIQAALPLCHAQSLARAQQISADLELEIMKEQEMMQELEQLIEIQDTRHYLSEFDYIPWKKKRLLDFSKGKQQAHIVSLPEPFSDVKMSSYFQTVYIHQTSVLNPHMKPVNVILWRILNGNLTACLISNQEADNLATLFKEHAFDGIWLTSTRGTVLTGKAPPGMAYHRQYHVLFEQCKLFGGRLLELLEQPHPFLWLRDDTAEKLSYFKEHIMLNRKSSLHDFEQLKNALSQPLISLFDEVARRAFHDLTQVDWARQYPKCCRADLSAIEQLAAALMSREPDNGGLLPPAAMPYVHAHWADVEAVMAAIHEMITSGNIEFSAAIFEKEGAIQYALTLMAEDTRLHEGVITGTAQMRP